MLCSATIPHCIDGGTWIGLLTEFTENAFTAFLPLSRCRSKLPVVSNPRGSVLARGCHTSFYRKRCLVCEQPMERKTAHQLVCGKRARRKVLRASSR